MSNSMSMSYDDFQIGPDVASLELEVDYEWEPYEEGYFNPHSGDGCGPSGGCPSGWTVKVTSALISDGEGNESKADQAMLDRLQKMVEEKLTNWIDTQLQENHSEPEE